MKRCVQCGYDIEDDDEVCDHCNGNQDLNEIEEDKKANRTLGTLSSIIPISLGMLGIILNPGIFMIVFGESADWIIDACFACLICSFLSIVVGYKMWDSSPLARIGIILGIMGFIIFAIWLFANVRWNL